LYDPNRHTRVQVIGWNEDGTPNFGVPIADHEPVSKP
ncbi:alpha-N-arabinofuranosidase, partial [Clostridium perfringens]